MRAVNSFRRVSGALLALTLALGVAACDNPVEDHEEHAVGLVVLNAQGQEVARINIEAANAVTGQLTTRVNSSQTYTVRILAEDGDQIAVGGEFSLQAAADNAQFATATIQSQNQLVVAGKQAGTTGVTLTLFHNGHPDFDRSVPLVVAP